MNAPEQPAPSSPTSTNPPAQPREPLEKLARTIQKALKAGDAAAVLAPLQEGVELAQRSGQVDLELILRMQLGVALLMVGDNQQALPALEAASRLGDRVPLKPGDWVALAWLMAVANLSRLLAATGAPAQAREELTRMRWRSRLLGLQVAEMQADLELARVCLQMEDYDNAREYAREFASVHARLVASPGSEPLPAELAEAGVVFGTIANHFYYEREDFAAAAELAALAVHLSPDEPDGYYLLANAQNALKRPEEALQTLESACARFPEKAFFHFNRAGALSALGRLEEAVPSLNQAVRLRPEDMKYRLDRARVFQALERHEEALGDLDEILRRGGGAAPAAAPATEAPRSQAEYERNMPPRDLADFAAVARVSSLRALGRIEEALAACAHLVAEGDDPTRAAGHDLAGTIHAEAGRDAEALAEWSSALVAYPTLDSARNARAALLSRLGRHEEALKDYAFLADRHQDPKEAIAGLTRLLEAHPDLHGGWRWRGFAHLENWCPREAVEDLTRAVEQNPSDAEAFYWRGLARITMAPKDEPWNKAFSWERILDALADFGTAVHLKPAAEDARAAYRWVFDRVSAEEKVLAYLQHCGDDDNGLFAVLPGVREALRLYFEGFALAAQRRWADAVASYRASQAALTEAGLAVFACRVHVNLADNYLRLYELQAALDHLAQAELLYQVIGQPLTSFLRPQASEISERSWKRSGQQAVGIEVDYMPLYGIGMQEHTLITRLLKAQALSRSGDPRAGAKALKPLRDFFRPSAQAGPTGSFRALSPIAIILRDAGQARLGLRVLRRLRPLLEGDAERLPFCNILGSLWEKLGKQELAIKWYRRTWAIARKVNSPLRVPAALNVGRLYANHGEPKKALAILERLMPQASRLSVRDQYAFHYSRATALWKAERASEAQETILAALDIAEQERSRMRMPETKIGFHERVQGVYEFAVRICLANGDRRTAFDLIERSRARAFLDELHTAALPAPPEAAELRVIEQNLHEQRELLERLRSGCEKLGPDYVDVDAITTLAAKYEYKDLVEQQGDGPRRVSLTKLLEHRGLVDRRLRELRHRRESMRLAAGGFVVGVTLKFQDLLDLMTNATTAAAPPGLDKPPRHDRDGT